MIHATVSNLPKFILDVLLTFRCFQIPILIAPPRKLRVAQVKAEGLTLCTELVQ